MFTLIKNGRVYAPENLGEKDILLVGQTIAHIADTIDLPKSLSARCISAEGQIVTPGFIDLHVHIAGGGGESPATRTPEIQLSKIVKAGVTTVIGCLGTDNVTRTPESLLAKAVQLDEEGISTFIYTGTYQVPPDTITGSVRKDIALIPKVVGIGELAIADHRSSQPTYDELCRIAAEARVGGMIGGKAGVVHLHLGSGARGLTQIMRIVNETEIPVGQFLPTHVSRSPELLEQAIEFAKVGGNLDLTAETENVDFLMPVKDAVSRLLEAGVPLGQLTISSDSNGSMPTFDEHGRLIKMGIGEIRNLYTAWKKLAMSAIPLEDALQLVTSNPAKRMGIFAQKGTLEPGKDADLVIFDDDLTMTTVIAKGRLMFHEGRLLAKGTFEE